MSGVDYAELIFHLRHGERDRPGARYGRPDRSLLASLAAKAGPVRLARHGQFWGETVDPLLAAAGMLVTGLHAVAPRFVMALCGRPGAIECWYAAADDSGAAVMPRLLKAHLRGPVPVAGSPAALTRALPYAVRISGTPSQPEPGARAVPVQSLCRGLFGQEWDYLVLARRLPKATGHSKLHKVEAEIYERTVLSKLTGRAEQFKDMEVYSDLMESLRQRYEEGMQLGLWDTEVVFAARDAGVLAEGTALLTGAIAGAGSQPDPVRANLCDEGVAGLDPPFELTSRQLALLVCPPGEAFPGTEIIPHAGFAAQPIAPPAARADTGQTAPRLLALGEVLFDGRASGNTLAMPLDDLTSHGIIAGMTGSGKTNTCFQILGQLAAHGVPFLVVESAKSEYRELLDDTRFKPPPVVFTVGNETVNPLRINPFAFPDGILVQTHIDYLKQAFSAAFEMWNPLPYVLERSLEEIYIDRGWDLTTGQNARAEGYAGPLRFPTLADLEATAPRVAATLPYGAEIMGNIQGGLTARLGQLRGAGGKGPMFDTRDSTPDTVLFERNCIIELKALAKEDEKAFLMGLLLIRLSEYHEARRMRGGDGQPPGTLRHVTVIEEAHRLLKNVSTAQSSESANPRGQAIEFFGNLLAEIRAFGEGVLMAEQIPVKLISDAIKNTNLKIIHRLVPQEDRAAVGAAMVLTQTQQEHLARLQRGEAAVYAERLAQAVLVKVPAQAAKERTGRGEASLPARPAPDRSTIQAMIGSGRRRAAAAHQRLWQSFVAIVFACLEPGDASADLPRRWAGEGGFTASAAGFLGPRVPPRLVFETLLDAEVEMRAGFWRPVAPFTAMATVLAIGARLAAALSAAPLATGTASAERAAFAAALGALGPARLPLEGCAACDKPCHYRPHAVELLETRAAETREIGMLVQEVLTTDRFASRVRLDEAGGGVDFTQVEPAPWIELAQRALAATAPTFAAAGGATRRGAAYCYMLHQFHDGAPAVAAIAARLFGRVLAAGGPPEAGPRWSPTRKGPGDAG